MSTPSAELLEAEKIEELADQLRADGYDVQTSKQGDPGFDIIAKRGGEVIVFEVKARSRLESAVPSINQLRQRAAEEGYSGFRLVVVNPPREIQVEIDGLQDLLQHQLAEDPPQDLDM